MQTISSSQIRTYDGDIVNNIVAGTVKRIVVAILGHRIANISIKKETYLNSFTAQIKLTACDERIQKLYERFVKAVKEELSRNPVLREAVALPNDAPFYISFVLQPVVEMAAELDKTQPGAVDDLIKCAAKSPAKLSELEILDEAIKKGQLRKEGLSLLSEQRLNALKEDRTELQKLPSLNEEQQKCLTLLNSIIEAAMV